MTQSSSSMLLTQRPNYAHPQGGQPQGQGQNGQTNGNRPQDQSQGGQGGQNGQGGQGQGQGQPVWGAPFPSLHLWPIQDTFVMKMIHLPEGQRIKIGRQTNNKTVPGERNAYFDSKVLSRTHAEIWEQGGKIYIKDLKSSNGTFINNGRLSFEGVESEPFEIKNEDLVEFGIDIVSEDNRTIVHHKVAAKVYCVFGPEDAALSARELVHYQNHDQRGVRRMQPGAPRANRAPNAFPQAGQAVLSAGGKANALSFDHVLHKLKAELAKSKETGEELQGLSSAMEEIQDTLGGGLPPSQNGTAAQFIPPQFRSVSAEAQAALAGPHGQQAAAFISLQNQLTDTQSSLTAHLDKIQQLEGQLKEHETLKHDLGSLREQMESSKREMESFLSRNHGRHFDNETEGNDENDDDDDTRSVVTLMDNEDAEERVRQRRNGEEKSTITQPERPPTPGPTFNGDKNSSSNRSDAGGSDPTPAQNSELVNRIQSLSAEIAAAEEVSRNLQAQHNEAMSAVKVLTQRVGVLEEGITSKVAEEVGKAEKKWESWRVKFEDSWRKERESWDAERERLRGVVREWEEASRRAHEEEEDRELNESLSEDDYNEEEEDEGGEEAEEGELIALGESWKDGDPIQVKGGVLGSLPPSRGGSGKSRRRRPSHRTLLAVRALKAVAASDENGSSTPKAETQSLEDTPPLSMASRLRVKEIAARGGGKLANGNGRKRGNGKLQLDRNGSASTIKSEKDSSESGKDSGDTLKESEKGVSSKKGKKKVQQPTPLQRPIPIFTVIMVAVFAGALYYRHKE